MLSQWHQSNSFKSDRESLFEGFTKQEDLKLAVIGLGYVGLPLAAIVAEYVAGYGFSCGGV